MHGSRIEIVETTNLTVKNSGRAAHSEAIDIPNVSFVARDLLIHTAKRLASQRLKGGEQ